MQQKDAQVKDTVLSLNSLTEFPPLRSPLTTEQASPAAADEAADWVVVPSKGRVNKQIAREVEQESYELIRSAKDCPTITTTPATTVAATGGEKGGQPGATGCGASYFGAPSTWLGWVKCR